MPRDAVPERALQIAADVGRRCSADASGVCQVHGWEGVSGLGIHLSAQAVTVQTLRRRRFPERALRWPAMWVGGVVVARVVCWVVWIADCLVQLATRAPKS